MKPIPVPISSQTVDVIENGTIRYGYDFFYNQPFATSIVLNGGYPATVEYKYIFRTIAPNDVGLLNYVSYL